MIAEKYGKVLFSSYNLRNRSFSTEVFETIIGDYGYSLVVSKAPDRKNLYSVNKVAACEANVNDVSDNE